MSINVIAEKVLGSHFTEKRAAFLTALLEKSRLGHLCASKDELPVADLPPEIVEEAKGLFPRAPIVSHESRYYLQRNWVLETYLLQETKRLRTQALPLWLTQEIFQKELPSKPLLAAQKAAIWACSKNCFSIISGGPGTGKTYTASYLVQLFAASLASKKRLRVMLTAPTGKAASHLHASIQKLNLPLVDIEAATLHRLLKLQPGKQNLFVKGSLDADLIIVDEASMIDLSLMAHLLQAVDDKSFLVMIGDPYQLPPVDGGSLFSEMAKLFGSKLEECLRTDEEELKQLAVSVKRGNVEALLKTLSSQKVNLYNWIQPLVSSKPIDPKEAMSHYGRRRIISPIRQGKDGIDRQNALLFEQVIATGNHWAVPILATVNDSWSGLYNGMNGILIGKGRGPQVAYFQESIYQSPPPYELAFCLSIHKSQGSEYEEVLALFPEGSEVFGREGLYTAITRAKKKVSLMGDSETLTRMTNSSAQTISAFSARFRDFTP